MESEAVLNVINRQSAAQTATSSHSAFVIGLTPGFNSLIKNSLNVCTQEPKIQEWSK